MHNFNYNWNNRCLSEAIERIAWSVPFTDR